MSNLENIEIFFTRYFEEYKKAISELVIEETEKQQIKLEEQKEAISELKAREEKITHLGSGLVRLNTSSKESKSFLIVNPRLAVSSVFPFLEIRPRNI